MTTTPKIPQNVVDRVISFVNSDASNKKTLYTGPANGAFGVKLSASTDDGSGRYMRLYISADGFDFCVTSALVSALVGTSNGSKATDFLSYYFADECIYDHNGNKIFQMGKDGQGTPQVISVKAAMDTSVTTAKTTLLKGKFYEY